MLAEFVAQDPGTLGRALCEVERRMERASPGALHELEEWAHLLSITTPRRLRDLLARPGERMTRLRQTMPVVRILASEDQARLTAVALDDETHDGRLDEGHRARLLEWLRGAIADIGRR